MAHPPPSVYSLVAEEKLTENLSNLWQQRFDKATHYIVDHLAEPLNWEDVAEACHISASHFRHMFISIFNETPGQFLTRMRLKSAVYLFYLEPEMSVTDVALGCGFSSSQALAKALKRDLKLSASAIRKMRFSDDEAFNLYLGRLLGQPLDNSDKVLEEQLAEDIPIDVVNCDDRYFQVQSVEQPSFNNMLTCWKSQKDKNTRLMSVIASWKSIAEIKADAACLVGVESGQSQFNHQLPAGRYLTSSFKIKDLSGYYFAWTRIYHYILTEGLEPSLGASVLEIYDSPNKVLARSMALSVFIHLDSQ